MEKLLRPYDKEYMKMAMLKHEETFKEQVNELHRLYRIQKILMKNIECSIRDQERWNSVDGKLMNLTNHVSKSMQTPKAEGNLEQPAHRCKAESESFRALDILDESEIELTLGPANHNRRRKTETPPLTSDSGLSFSSSSSGSNHINRASVRLDASDDCPLGLVQVPYINTASKTGDSIDCVEGDSRERHKQSPWLFQVLSLNSS